MCIQEKENATYIMLTVIRNFNTNIDVQCSPFIILYLVSIGMNRVISGQCYKGLILQRNYRKMTIYGQFSIIA